MHGFKNVRDQYRIRILDNLLMPLGSSFLYVAIFSNLTVKNGNTKYLYPTIFQLNNILYIRKSLLFRYIRNRVVIKCLWLQGIGKRFWSPSDLQQDSRTDGGSTEDLRRCAWRDGRRRSRHTDGQTRMPTTV